MATDITNRQKELQGDGDFYLKVKGDRPVTLKIIWTSGTTGGSVAIEDAQESPYRTIDDTADLAVAFDDTVNKYQIDPVGGRIYLKATGVVGSWKPMLIEQASGSA